MPRPMACRACVVDRFGDMVVVEVNSAGMDRLTRAAAPPPSTQVLKPTTILIRGEGSARTMEGPRR